MGSIRARLPHETDRLFLTDGGTETWLAHKRGFELPYFSSFHLLKDRAATEAIRSYYGAFAAIAVDHGTAFVFDSLTYRASRGWGALLGYSDEELEDVNHACLALYREVATEVGLAAADVVISGCVGPKDDAYQASGALDEDAYEAYHHAQVATFGRAGADVVTALSLGSSREALGIVRAARSVGVPVAISFLVEKDHRLPSRETLRAAIETVDHATDGIVAYYMINCAHPLDFEPALAREPWVERVRGVRANASKLEHAVLDRAGRLDEGDADELADQYASLKARYPHMNVFGGCCGTDFHHVRKISEALRAI